MIFLFSARAKLQEQVKNLELQIVDLQSATQDAEAAAEKIERQRRSVESDLQVLIPQSHFLFCTSLSSTWINLIV